MISEQEFLKWRCLIALGHVDGVFLACEEDLIRGHMASVEFSEDQKKKIDDEMKSARCAQVIYQEMTDEEQKHHLIQLAFQLFLVDHEFHEAEQKIFLRLRKGPPLKEA